MPTKPRRPAKKTRPKGRPRRQPRRNEGEDVNLIALRVVSAAVGEDVRAPSKKR